MFLVVGAANAADKWEYVHFTKTTDIGRNLTQFILAYPDGKKDVWSEKRIIPPKLFFDFAAPRCDKVDFALMADALKKDFSQPINVINALGICGFEMSGYNMVEASGIVAENFWFKRNKSSP